MDEWCDAGCIAVMVRTGDLEEQVEEPCCDCLSSSILMQFGVDLKPSVVEGIECFYNRGSSITPSAVAASQSISRTPRADEAGPDFQDNVLPNDQEQWFLPVRLSLGLFFRGLGTDETNKRVVLLDFFVVASGGYE